MKKFIYVLALLPALSFAQTSKEAQYCDAKSDYVDQAACLKEARNARAEAKRGGLTTPTDLTANKYLRCREFSIEDESDCRKRINRGVTTGSVDGGGTITVYTETLTTK